MPSLDTVIVGDILRNLERIFCQFQRGHFGEMTPLLESLLKTSQVILLLAIISSLLKIHESKDEFGKLTNQKAS